MKKARKILIVLMMAILSVASISITSLAADKKEVVSIKVTNVQYGIVTVPKGTSFNIATEVVVTGGVDKSVKYTSSNSKVATVSSTGRITGVAAGKTTITITSKADASKSTALTVYVGRKATKVTISKNTVTAYVGTKLKLSAAVDSQAACKEIKWLTSDKTVATVDAIGNVIPKKAGKVTIFAKAKDNSNVYAKCIVTVKESVTSLKVTNVSYGVVTLKKGATFTVKADIKVAQSSLSKELAYKSSNKSVATVSSTGKITALKNGSAIITVISKQDISKKKTIKVYVGNPVSKITLDNTEVTVNKGGRTYITGTVDDKATYKYVAYYSSDESIATVNSKGFITTKKAGTVKIYAIARDNSGVKAACTVNVINHLDGYNLVFEDNFDGDSLDTTNWNYEEHAPGWVNEELQSYVAGDSNVYLKNGKLVIDPNKDEEGNITSGRINTLGKQQFKYGYFETRAKVPTGAGYLPAFWLMSADENLYGQWPRCGEIDIMEVMGHETNKTYGTIHYGNPHGQSQGTYTLPLYSYADLYHTFACEWEPGSIKWYVDGVLIHEEHKWYSTTEGQGTVTYPAPFDQEFYIILNLAVGGSWVGYPDENTSYDENFQIDYVKVYQKDSYNEDVEMPIEDIIIRDPDENGNYVINGDFSKADPLDGTKDWQFLTALGGKGSASIVNEQVEIKTEAAGTADYSIQLVQPNIPLEKGYQYEISFDAYADEERTMIADISAPSLNYLRYFNDTKVALTTEKQNFKYTFDMTMDTDDKARVEFNLGKTASNATVYIDNVVIKKVKEIEIIDKKTPRSDGNYIYNGKFQEGANRLGYWEINGDEANIVEYNVTSLEDGRKFHINTKDCESLENVTLRQTEVPFATNVDYALSFDAKCATGETATINVLVGGELYTFDINDTMTTYTAKYSVGEEITSDEFVVELGANKDIYLDNISLTEDAIIKNGSFNAGMSGYEVYGASGTDYTAVIDSLSEDNAFDITIKNTGANEWDIQLKQNNVELIKDQWYTFKFDIKSDMARQFKYALQKDGSADNDWSPYADGIIDLAGDGEYVTITKTFKNKKGTDPNAILSFSMGAVAGEQITTAHRICIDNISLVMVDEPQKPDVPTTEDVEILVNPGFTDGNPDPWFLNKWADGDAEAVYEDGIAKINVKAAGTETSSVQLVQNDLTIEEGATYIVKFKIKSSLGRNISWSLLDPSNGYNWYAGEDISLTADEISEIEYEFTCPAGDEGKPGTDTMAFQINMGYFEGACDPSAIEISDISIVKKGVPASDVEILVNPGFTDGNPEPWFLNKWADGDAEAVYEDGIAKINVKAAGTETSSVQLVQNDLTIEEGATYIVKFKIKSSLGRNISWSLLDPSNGYNWYAGEDISLTADEISEIEYEFTCPAGDEGKPGTDTMAFQINMGYFEGACDPSAIEISDISIIKKTN